MITPQLPEAHNNRPVAIWLFIGVVMIVVQIILGGITRLTGSGLSITEWKPLLGAIPNLHEAGWNDGFQKDQQIAQFIHLNSHFSLSDFQFIYFWEWFHRLWGRLLGVVFLIPFIYFLVKGRFRKNMALPLAILFLLGGLQGLIGWIMVKSGLNDESLYVSHFRLAIHFMAAMALLVYTFWFMLKLMVPEEILRPNRALKNFALAILVLLCVQLVYGAFMAGLKAGAFAPTWPDINGAFAPASLFAASPWLINFIENKITIHFVHRNLAYLILVLTLILSVKLYRLPASTKYFNRLKGIPVVLVLTQVVLGVASLVFSPGIQPNKWGTFEWMAQLHQVTGMLFALSLFSLLYLVRRR